MCDGPRVCIPFLPYFWREKLTEFSERPVASVTLKCSRTSFGDLTNALSILALWVDLLQGQAFDIACT